MTAALKLFKSEPEWTQEQLAALEAVRCWRSADHAPFFRLGGFAGTGKTTLMGYLSKEWPDAAVCAYTGKAASVLRSKGCEDASTIHGLIYRPWEDADGLIHFTKQKKIKPRTIIVDEASMVGKWIHEDLMSFGRPILYVGDHGQLEPIGDAGGLSLMSKPDARLETIHRQAADNPILRAAAAFREGRHEQVKRAKWTDPSGRLIITHKDKWRDHLDAQIICGTNKTRHYVNRFMRERKGLTTHNTPVAGDKIVCLLNNHVFGIYNGQQFDVVTVGNYKTFTDLVIRNDEGQQFSVPCLLEQFGKDKVTGFQERGVVLFDYGYALTGHKSQGSEWRNVTVIEELAPAWDGPRWRYTVATRASERLVYCG